MVKPVAVGVGVWVGGLGFVVGVGGAGVWVTVGGCVGIGVRVGRGVDVGEGVNVGVGKKPDSPMAGESIEASAFPSAGESVEASMAVGVGFCWVWGWAKVPQAVFKLSRVKIRIVVNKVLKVIINSPLEIVGSW